MQIDIEQYKKQIDYLIHEIECEKLKFTNYYAYSTDHHESTVKLQSKCK